MNSRRAIVFTLIEMLIAIAFLGTLAECAARLVAEPSNA
jgi:prepilin-type N-terminal cleavage/methylation domain-containing protein